MFGDLQREALFQVVFEFIDDHSQLFWIYILNKKFEVEEFFLKFYHMIENQFQTKIVS